MQPTRRKAPMLSLHRASHAAFGFNLILAPVWPFNSLAHARQP
jgi:hypothetical protein